MRRMTMRQTVARFLAVAGLLDQESSLLLLHDQVGQLPGQVLEVVFALHLALYDASSHPRVSAIFAQPFPRTRKNTNTYLVEVFLEVFDDVGSDRLAELLFA